ncbi:MAG: TetR/AcrR family transcriptional regulator [Alphaproteobacteria bacterium]|nr:TetR/AcrR family transcriptional regulator [Alphaproteobacteria bacterium]
MLRCIPDVFAPGLKLATMNDVAGEAGVTRQTVRNLFANRDELLRATIPIVPWLPSKVGADVVRYRPTWHPAATASSSGVQDVARWEVILDDARCGVRP